MKPPQKTNAGSEQEFTVDGLSLRVKPLTIQFNNTSQSTNLSSRNRLFEATSSKKPLAPETSKSGSSSTQSLQQREELDRKSRLLARLQEISAKRSEQQPEPQRKLRITYIPSSDSDCSRQPSPPNQKCNSIPLPTRTVEMVNDTKERAGPSNPRKISPIIERSINVDRDVKPKEVEKTHSEEKETKTERSVDTKRTDDKKMNIPATFEKSRITFPTPEKRVEREKEKKEKEMARKPPKEKSPECSDREKRPLAVRGDRRRGKSLEEKKDKLVVPEDRRKSDRAKDIRRSPVPEEQRKKEDATQRKKIPSLLDLNLRKRSLDMDESNNRVEAKVSRVVATRPDRSPRRRNPRLNGRRNTDERRTSREPEVVEFVIPKVISTSPEPIIPFFTNVYVFSNHFRCPYLDIDGRRYCCTEQYYMWQKAMSCDDIRAAKRIMATQDPKEMKHISMDLRAFDPLRWDKLKDKIMLKANYQKFVQFSDLRHQLFRTAGGCLVEASPQDTYWGVGLALDSEDLSNRELWKGKNQLGEVLMAIRDELMSFPEYEEEVKKAKECLLIDTYSKPSNGVHHQNGDTASPRSNESEMEN